MAEGLVLVVKVQVAGKLNGQQYNKKQEDRSLWQSILKEQLYQMGPNRLFNYRWFANLKTLALRHINLQTSSKIIIHMINYLEFILLLGIFLWRCLAIVLSSQFAGR